jgi:hypothetical protein
MVADENPWAWMIEYDRRHVGTARLYNHVAIDRKAAYAVALNSSGLLGRGLGTEVTRSCLTSPSPRSLTGRVCTE